jgi:hypothetical protein
MATAKAAVASGHSKPPWTGRGKVVRDRDES